MVDLEMGDANNMRAAAPGPRTAEGHARCLEGRLKAIRSTARCGATVYCQEEKERTGGLTNVSTAFVNR